MLKYFLIKVKELLGRGSVYPAFFDITSKCNLKCPHCYFFRGRQTKCLSLEEWEALFAKYQKEHFHHAVLSGGEPTLNPDVIFLADKFFPIVNIATNGLIKIPSVIRHTILVSLDGQKEIHEKIRGPRTFDRILANYKNDKRVIYRMTISKLNLNEIETVTQIAQRNNVRGISFIIYAHYLEKDPLCLNQAELEEVRIWLLDVMEKYKGFVYLTPKILNAMVYSEFAQDCALRGGVALHSDGTRKKCTMNNIDCATCKCPTPALLHTYKTDLQTFLLGLKYY
jgi:MoaA/NifB/PqqE/SkfB family radical SAM enzyme